jgi:hypothetical protein
MPSPRAALDGTGKDHQANTSPFGLSLLPVASRRRNKKSHILRGEVIDGQQSARQRLYLL